MFIVEEESHYTDYDGRPKVRKHRYVYETQEEVDEQSHMRIGPDSGRSTTG